MRAILVAALFLTACDVGEVAPASGGEGPDAGIVNNSSGGGGEQSFESMVAPLVEQHHCLICHGSSQSPNLTSFAVLGSEYETKPGAQNILVTKGDATGGQHEGIQYFTAGEKTTVASWIDSLR